MQVLGYYPEVRQLSTNVHVGDPLKILVKWKNNQLEEYTNLGCIVVFMCYDENENRWKVTGYRKDNTLYAWGCYKITLAPKKNEVKTDDLYSYAIIKPKYEGERFGVGVIFALWEHVSKIDTHKADLGYGTRVVGLEATKYSEVVRNYAIAIKAFPDKFKLYSRPPEETPPPEEGVPLDILDVQVMVA